MRPLTEDEKNSPARRVPPRLCLSVCSVSSWLRQDVHSEEEELHSSDEEDNSSTSSKEHLDEADRQVMVHSVLTQQTAEQIHNEKRKFM